jgi:DNA polymerase-3 subunit delta
VVHVENADPFVTRERDKLEQYAAEPSATGVLILDVTAWPSTTRLAKQLPDAVITCKAPAPAKLIEWCQKWAPAQHGKPLAVTAARLLVDLIGADMGLLDQELAKLSLYVGSAARIESADVDQLVGRSREENTWKIFDLLGAGQVPAALAFLDRLLSQGEEAMKLLAAFSLQLRRLGQAARLYSQGTPLSKALEEAGVPPFAHKSTEQHMRYLGRRRLDRLYDWLLQTDLGLKGSSHLPPRVILERLVIQLARPAPPAKATVS